MLDLVPDVRGSDIIVESFRIVLYDYLALTFAFVFPLDELLLDCIVAEWFHEGAEFLLLVVSGRATRVHEDLGADDCC